MTRILRRWLAPLCLVLMVQAGPGAPTVVRETAPETLKTDAMAAVQVLGDQVVQQNYSYTIQRMYPRWKAQAAKRMGGMEKLVEALAEVPKEMKRNGITILSFKAGLPEEIFEVTGVVAKTAEGKELLGFAEWLAFVPTTTKYLVIEKETARKRRLMTTGFQVAVCNKKTNEWSFIDGSNLKIEELRRLFPDLPRRTEALKLPEVSPLKEIK